MTESAVGGDVLITCLSCVIWLCVAVYAEVLLAIITPDSVVCHVLRRFVA